ncbi:MAG: hypothetical protein ABIR16_09055 [Dokdonella sp.]
MNVRKLMARLNPTTIRYDVGQGGVPEMTSVDIAGAIGMIPDHRARDVLCAVWWPSGTNERAAQDAIRARVMTEYCQRASRLDIARLNLRMAQADVDSRQFRSGNDRTALKRSAERFDELKAQAWPWNAEVYRAIVQAVILELRNPNQCETCRGREETPADNGVRSSCKDCEGTGLLLAPGRERARRIGVPESTYRAMWASPYEWTLDLVSTLEKRGAIMLRDRLQDRLADAA